MFNFIVSVKDGYTHASLSDWSGYAAFHTKVDGDDIGSRFAAVMQTSIDGVETYRRSSFTAGVDALLGPYAGVSDTLHEEAVWSADSQ
jgi:hypothetical protein